VSGVTDTLTHRWRGVTALAFTAGALGIAAGAPAVLLVGGIGVAYAAYAQSTVTPTVEVRVDRTIEEPEPDEGDATSVVVEVTNAGPDVLPDLRVVDGVPETLEVVGGSPRSAVALRPGESAAFEYEVRAERGHHEFGAATAVARDWAGGVERRVDVETESALTCVPDLESLPEFPVRNRTARYAGSVPTDTGGPGIEFYATREYRRGDPLSRIDWKRRARTGDLATVQFRQEQGATAVVVVDTREEAYVSGPNGVSAVEHSVRAARSIAPALLDGGNPVGVAAFGPETSWLGPSLGRVHEARLREHLALEGPLSPQPPEEDCVTRTAVRDLLQRIPSDAQVVFVSPTADNSVPVVVRRFEAYGHPVTLVSPDVTGGDSPGVRLAAMERADRIRAVREVGIRVIDWDPETPLAVAVENAKRGWSV
jgi:uncharacterized protein (DUF58 family)